MRGVPAHINEPTFKVFFHGRSGLIPIRSTRTMAPASRGGWIAGPAILGSSTDTEKEDDA